MREVDHGTVTLRLPSGELHTLFHGDLIGRLWSAALRLDDARISEAHAMVSNRGREMKLLALRGRFMVEGVTLTEVELRAGMQIMLAPGIELEVAAVTLPLAVMLIEAEGLAARSIPGVLSLFGGQPPKIRTGWRPDAHGWLWPTGEGWMRSGEPPISVHDGDAWELGGSTFRARLEAPTSGTDPTQQVASLSLPLTLIARYDSVHIQRPGMPVLTLSGRSARLISELVVLRQPCSWEVLAVDLWGELDRYQLRQRWDMQLQRLRQKLRAATIRVDLVHATGNGLIELVLGPADVVVDET
jgi:hypothetical protein